MKEKGVKSSFGLENMGLVNLKGAYWNLTPSELIEDTLCREMGELADSGGLCVDTGEFTGRSPKDKFVVLDESTQDTVWWGDINHQVDRAHYLHLWHKVQAYLQQREVWVRDMYAGADPQYRIKVRVVNEIPWANLFVSNMFIQPEPGVLKDFIPDWTVVAAPGFFANPSEDDTRQHNFSIINFTDNVILVGGSGYTGEIKKGVFTVLNYLLPQKGVLPMHCSANIGKSGDTAIFFGLSGTGKTTLSADPQRELIGDDEHGWSESSIFNFEGGCYAKCIGLTRESEPEIWDAIKYGALLENTRFFQGTRKVDFDDVSVTQNTRVSYPIDHISNARIPSVGHIPRNIFFLTCDAFGVLPPISKLTAAQAMYQFISGYTAKVAGTEEGVTEPDATFSACFGEPFLPLPPTRYAEMLGEKIQSQKVDVWLINTGWTGGAFGVGSRIKLRYTRAMITAVLEGDLHGVSYLKDPIFGLSYPEKVPGVPAELLNPKNTWEDKQAYDRKAGELAAAFVRNFEKYRSFANEEILSAAPRLETA